MVVEVAKYLLFFLTGILGLIIVYTFFRVISLGIFKSWFDIKKQQEDKK